RRQEQDLLAAHREEWAEPILGIARSYAFRRGFLELADMEAGTFAKNAKKLLAALPLIALTLTNHQGSALTRLLKSSYMARICELRFRECFPDEGEWEAFASSKHIRNMTHLCLDNPYTETEVLPLFSSDHLTKLTHLELAGHLEDPHFQA